MPATTINSIKNFLSRKSVSLAIIALAVGSRVIQLVYFFNIRVDGSFQVMATQGLVDGHGISIAKVLPGDLSATVYHPLINWPPGYSLLLAPFYILFNHDYVAAGLALDILSALTLLLITRKILGLFHLPSYLINIYTFCTGFFLYYFYFIASSDAIGITFFIIALYAALLLCKEDTHWKRRIAIMCFALLVFAFLKYLFIPVAFIIPFFLLMKGIADHHAKIKKAGFISLLILAFAIGGLLIYQKYISGSAAYISSPERGFFPQHLLETYPFIPASFLQPMTIDQLTAKTHRLYSILFGLFQGLHIIVLLFFTGYFLSEVYKRRFRNISYTGGFFYVTFLVSVTISILLSILSITVDKEEIIPGLFWTYVEEPRYYGLPNVLLHLGIFIGYQYTRTKSSGFLKYVFYFLFLLLAMETMRGIIFDTRRIINFRKEEYSWQYEKRLQQYADQLIAKKKKEFSLEKVVVTGSSYMNSRVSLYNHIPVMEEVDLINNPSSLKTKEPVLLLVILFKNDLGDFGPFLSAKVNKPDGEFDGFSFYTIYVTPR